jgi:hypothetical protein
MSIHIHILVLAALMSYLDSIGNENEGIDNQYQAFQEEHLGRYGF